MDEEGPTLPRRWIDNSGIDATTQVNRTVVAGALAGSNIAFGLHRWYYGGSSPDPFAISTISQWDNEIARGRAGDNLMLVSLEAVAHLAFMHLGNLRTVTFEELQPAWSFLASTANELFAVTRPIAPSDEASCSIEILWDPTPADQAEHVEEWRKAPGELWLFDSDVVWQPGARNPHLPKNQWTARHGHFLLDAYIPDTDGRVPEGGAY